MRAYSWDALSTKRDPLNHTLFVLPSTPGRSTCRLRCLKECSGGPDGPTHHACRGLNMLPAARPSTRTRHSPPTLVTYLPTLSLPLSLPPATATDIYRVYRTYTASFRSRPVIRDILIDTQLRNPHAPTAANRHQLAAATGVGIVTGPGSHASKADPAAPPPPPVGSCSAMVWLDQHVTPKLLPLPYVEAIVPTIVLLKFRPCPETGRPLVYEQYDHVSLYGFTWSFGPLTRYLFDCVMAPAVMYGMGVQAYCLDVLEETWRFVRQQVLGEPYGAGVGQGGEGGTCGGGDTSSSSSSSTCPAGAGGGSGAGCGLPRGVKTTPGAPGGGLEVTSGRKLRNDLPGEVDHAKTGGYECSYVFTLAHYNAGSSYRFEARSMPRQVGGEAECRPWRAATMGRRCWPKRCPRTETGCRVQFRARPEASWTLDHKHVGHEYGGARRVTLVGACMPRDSDAVGPRSALRVRLCRLAHAHRTSPRPRLASPRPLLNLCAYNCINLT